MKQSERPQSDQILLKLSDNKFLHVSPKLLALCPGISSGVALKPEKPRSSDESLHLKLRLETFEKLVTYLKAINYEPKNALLPKEPLPHSRYIEQQLPLEHSFIQSLTTAELLEVFKFALETKLGFVAELLSAHIASLFRGSRA